MTECLVLLYSGGPGYKPRPRKPAILTDIFRGFTQPSRNMTGTYFKLGHDHFLPQPFEVTFHPFIRRCTV
jgi:hypothetical protein